MALLQPHPAPTHPHFILVLISCLAQPWLGCLFEVCRLHLRHQLSVWAPVWPLAFAVLEATWNTGRERPSKSEGPV